MEKKGIKEKDILEVLKKFYPESIFVTDGDGNVIFANEVAAERLNVELEELLHKNVVDLMEEGIYDNSSVLAAMKRKKPSVATLTYKKTNNISVSNSIPVMDEEGNVVMVVTDNMSLRQNQQWESIISKQKEETNRLRRELDYLRLQDHTAIIAESPSMKNILKTIEIIAPTDSNVVVLGESGTGKDLMARLIHQKSDRKDNSFISINCAALPEQLLESELFGYEGGAFTGALSAGKIGLFEAADGGTIFLDEIGDMPLSLQSKLLRTLENHEIRRVGGVKNIPVDVRVICATNADLHSLVEDKKFREDLYYRLSVFLINLPPLCERKEDIIPLAKYYLKVLNEKYGTEKYLSKESINTMLKHKWPGNIRELRNVIERIFVVSEGDLLEFLPVPRADVEKGKNRELQPAGIQNDLPLKAYMEMVEQEYIKEKLRACGGAINETASALGIHRSVLYRKLHKDKA